MKELDKLEQYLKEKKYKYKRIDKHGEGGMKWLDRHQILVFDENGERQWDVICHYGSYGYEEGLLEAYGSIVIREDDVEGWLTAEDIIRRLEA